MRHVASKLPSACWSGGLLYGKMHKIWYLFFPNCPLKANTFSPLIHNDYTGSWGVYAMSVWDQTEGGVQAWEEAAALPIPSRVRLHPKKTQPGDVWATGGFTTGWMRGGKGAARREVGGTSTSSTTGLLPSSPTSLPCAPRMSLLPRHTLQSAALLQQPILRMLPRALKPYVTTGLLVQISPGSIACPYDVPPCHALHAQLWVTGSRTTCEKKITFCRQKASQWACSVSCSCAPLIPLCLENKLCSRNLLSMASFR